MLLYDRVREAVHKKCPGGPMHDLLNGMPVYDLNDVVPLFGDWEVELRKPVPRRPPHPHLWAEWSQSNIIPGLSIRLGVILLEISVKDIPDRHRVLGGKECYRAIVFQAIESMSDRFASMRQAVNRPMVLPHIATFYVPDSWASGTTVVSDLDTHLAGAGTSGFVIPVPRIPPNVPTGRAKDMLPSVWPLFMCFALLHCKNVATEDHVPDERIQRQCAKHNNPPRVTYKTLKIEVPASVHKNQSIDATDDGSGPKVRFHLCSGHFKNLQHERYKNKGWHWWPAHWKGSRDLGAVVKDYQLVASGEPQ